VSDINNPGAETTMSLDSTMLSEVTPVGSAFMGGVRSRNNSTVGNISTIGDNFKSKEEQIVQLESMLQNQNAELERLKQENMRLRDSSFRSFDEFPSHRGSCSDLLAALNESSTLQSGHAVGTQHDLHLAFMFSAPLVTPYRDVNGKLRMKKHEALNYSDEIKFIDNLQETKKKVLYRKCAATVENLSKIFDENPMALHFSGHGVKNTEENFGRSRLDEGDFLVFEDSHGVAHFVSCTELGRIIATSRCSLEFVFVASCHSSLVGDIFKNAGAKHVICIKRDEKILDDASITFAKTFYHAIFSGNRSICQAFETAKAQVRIDNRFPPGEENKFILLRDEEDLESSDFYSARSQEHRCQVLQLEDGEVKDVALVPTLQEIPACVDNFVGRHIMMHEIINLIYANRLVTLKGIPGIGKTSLAKAVANYLYERQYPRDGIIYISLRGHETVGSVLYYIESKVRTKGNMDSTLDISRTREINRLGLALIESKRKQASSDHKEFISDILDGIYDSLKGLQGLFIMDNAEDVILSERDEFCDLIHRLLTNIPGLRIMMTSRCSIGSTLPDITEKIVNIPQLDPTSATLLFQEKATRPIQEEEVNELLNEDARLHLIRHKKLQASKIAIDSTPSVGARVKLKALDEHPLMEMLSGHPQAISMAASLLQEHSLTELYHLLESKRLDEALDGSDKVYGDEKSFTSLRVSLDASVAHLRMKNPQTVRFFALLGLFPSGASEDDFESIWGNDWYQHTVILQRHSMLVKKSKSVTDSSSRSMSENMYGLLPFMNDYARWILESDDVEDFQTRLIAHYCKLLMKAFNYVATQHKASARYSDKLLLTEPNIWACITVDFKDDMRGSFTVDEDDEEFADRELKQHEDGSSRFACHVSGLNHVSPPPLLERQRSVSPADVPSHSRLQKNVLGLPDSETSEGGQEPKNERNHRKSLTAQPSKGEIFPEEDIEASEYVNEMFKSSMKTTGPLLNSSLMVFPSANVAKDLSSPIGWQCDEPRNMRRAKTDLVKVFPMSDNDEEDIQKDGQTDDDDSDPLKLKFGENPLTELFPVLRGENGETIVGGTPGKRRNSRLSTVPLKKSYSQDSKEPVITSPILKSSQPIVKHLDLNLSKFNNKFLDGASFNSVGELNEQHSSPAKLKLKSSLSLQEDALTTVKSVTKDDETKTTEDRDTSDIDVDDEIMAIMGDQATATTKDSDSLLKVQRSKKTRKSVVFKDNFVHSSETNDNDASFGEQQTHLTVLPSNVEEDDEEDNEDDDTNGRPETKLANEEDCSTGSSIRDELIRATTSMSQRDREGDDLSFQELVAQRELTTNQSALSVRTAGSLGPGVEEVEEEKKNEVEDGAQTGQSTVSFFGNVTDFFEALPEKNDIDSSSDSRDIPADNTGSTELFASSSTKSDDTLRKTPRLGGGGSSGSALDSFTTQNDILNRGTLVKSTFASSLESAKKVSPRKMTLADWQIVVHADGDDEKNDSSSDTTGEEAETVETLADLPRDISKRTFADTASEESGSSGSNIPQIIRKSLKKKTKGGNKYVTSDSSDSDSNRLRFDLANRRSYRNNDSMSSLESWGLSSRCGMRTGDFEQGDDDSEADNEVQRINGSDSNPKKPSNYSSGTNSKTGTHSPNLVSTATSNSSQSSHSMRVPRSKTAKLTMTAVDSKNRGGINRADEKLTAMGQLLSLYTASLYLLGRYFDAVKVISYGLPISQRFEDKFCEANLRKFLGLVHYKNKNYDNAKTEFNHSRELYRLLNSHLGQAGIYTCLGHLNFSIGEHNNAKFFYEKAFSLYKSMAHKFAIYFVNNELMRTKAKNKNLKEQVEEHRRNGKQLRNELRVLGKKTTSTAQGCDYEGGRFVPRFAGLEVSIFCEIPGIDLRELSSKQMQQAEGQQLSKRSSTSTSISSTSSIKTKIPLAKRSPNKGKGSPALSAMESKKGDITNMLPSRQNSRKFLDTSKEDDMFVLNRKSVQSALGGRASTKGTPKGSGLRNSFTGLKNLNTSNSKKSVNTSTEIAKKNDSGLKLNRGSSSTTATEQNKTNLAGLSSQKGVSRRKTLHPTSLAAQIDVWHSGRPSVTKGKAETENSLTPEQEKELTGENRKSTRRISKIPGLKKNTTFWK